MQELKIDKRLEEEFPPLSDEAFKQLEENILKDGLMEKLVVWDGTIVDGHNRYKICRKHNIPFEVVEKDFPNIEAAIIWMIAHQIGRRNMSEIERIEKALKREDMIREQAKRNQIRKPESVLIKRSEQTPINTRQKLADLAGTSPAKIQRVKKIREEGDPDVYEKVKSGEISIWDGYEKTRKKVKEEKQISEGVKTCTLCTVEKPLSDFRKGGSVCKTCLSSVESLGMSVTEFREKYDTSQMAKLAGVYDEMKNPPPSSGSGNNSLSDDPIITEMTETIKSFRNAMNKFLFIEEKTDKALKDLIKETIEELTEINSIIKE